MTKVVIVGAGSGFGGRLSLDVLSREPLRESTIGLTDIHAGRLELVKGYVERTIRKYELPAKVEASTDRREILPGADFIVTSISAGGGAYHGFPADVEVEIPRKYGIEQSVADTVSTGAVFRFLRTGPVHLQIFRDIEKLCPDALVLNHTNPMAMLTWAHHAATNVANVGLCHGVQGTSMRIAKLLEVDYDEMSFTCVGINHLAWFTELRRGREDLYPRLRALADDPEKVGNEKVRFAILKHFGYYPTESSGHDSEYMPYFRRTPELLERYGLGQRKIAKQGPRKRAWMVDTGIDDEAGGPVGELRLSREYSTGIMEAVVTNVPYRFNGNVMNDGLVANLPAGSCVEVPCMADSRGVHPCHVPDLPPHLAAICRSNIAVQELAVRAVLDRDREAAFHACCLDPLTAAVASLDDIRAMFEELWEAEKGLLMHFDPSHSGPVPEKCAE
ncbi:MAG: family 4 glycosyl hydrolase [Planctomycetota bacterium]|jgi:alpha-galactosidase